MSYVIYPGDIQKRNRLGGKAEALAALHQTGLPIPAWFVLTPDAFYASLNEEQPGMAANADSGQMPTLLEELSLSPTIQSELNQALAKLCPQGELVAVRSSALDEDSADHSFAGQLESFLDVPSSEVAQKVTAVWRSGYSERLLAYRRERGLEPLPQPPAVLIQRMVRPDFAGVAFSADPVTGNPDVVVVAAVAGLGLALVSGEVDADTYRVDRQGGIVDRHFSTADRRPPTADWEERAHGSSLLNLDNQPPITNHQLPITDSQIQAVADLTRQVERFFGRPQDIEWAIEAGQLYLLQARPITTLPGELKISEVSPARRSGQPKTWQDSKTSDLSAEGNLNLWDNSNISESYPGVTTPLTFSFARRAYEEVYRQFCRLMGVPAETVANHALTFRRMLGLMQGQIYYNLLSWHRVLALLPGYKLNRRFMEQMMGVKETLPDELLDRQAPPNRADRLRDSLYLLRTLLGLLSNYLLLGRRIEAFYGRLNQALGPGRPDLSHYRPDELAAYYRLLERQLLSRWDAPLVNDFFAMIFYGLLRKLAETWCGDANGTLQNDLLRGSGDTISAEPARRMVELAHLAAAAPDFATLLRQGPLPDILARLPEQPQFLAQYQAYLDKFGDRCLEELKLESPTLHDDPLLLFRSVGGLAQAGEQGSRGAGEQRSPHPRAGRGVGGPRNEAQLPITNYQLPLLRRLIFQWILQNTRRLIRNRENLRFERTRLFGRARLIFLELGRKFYELGLLADPKDIFYLEVEEALGLVEGVTSTTNLKALVTLRKAEFDHYRTLPPLPNHFETRGIPFLGKQSLSSISVPNQEIGSMQENPKSKIQNLKSLRGLGCCPGLVRGPVRVVTNPKTAQLQPGEILVARRTDPGWILLFPAAAGLLVEHGSLLSHSAIVSRELGLPAIVSLTGVTEWLKDGDWVEFDGSTGMVTKVEPYNTSGVEIGD